MAHISQELFFGCHLGVFVPHSRTRIRFGERKSFRPVMAKIKTTKTKVLRARATEEEKKAVEWAAAVECLDPADIIRRACSRYVTQLKSAQMPMQHAA